MDKLYLGMLRRWIWLLALATIISAVAAYYVGNNQARSYQASASLIVGPGVDGLSPDLNDLRAGGQLMQTYAELATTRPVLQDVVDEVDSTLDPDDVEKNIAISVDQDTQILSIQVTDSDPDQAAAIANAVADVLVKLSPSGGESPAAVLNAQMRQQATQLEENITAIETRIVEFEAALLTAETSDDQSLFMEQLSQDRTQLADARATLAILYNSLQNTPTNQVKIVETAVVGNPISRRLPLVVMTAGMAGLIVALVIALGFEYYDDTVKSAEELGRSSGFPVLGTIHLTGDEGSQISSRLVVRPQSKSPAAEDYRMLGTKLPANMNSSPLRSVVVSSVDKNETAGEVATNLAVVLAQTGSRVILLDANLHQPTANQLLGITTRFGLAHALTSHSRPPELTLIDWAPGLSVLPSGTPTYDSFSRLASPHMMNLLDQLERQADIVIISASPLLNFADSLLLSSRADGVILVTSIGDTEQSKVKAAVDSLQSVDAHIIGSVLVSHGGGFRATLKNAFGRLRRVGKRMAEGDTTEYQPTRVPSFLRRSNRSSSSVAVQGDIEESVGRADRASSG